MKIINIEATKLLNPVSGCLAEWSANVGDRGVTHTLNPFIGCPIGWSQCGNACYAKHFLTWKKRGHTRNEWGHYVYLKENAPSLYLHEFKTSSGTNGLGIFASSVTEPLPPHPKARAIMRALLEAMIERPPGRGLIIQTHTSYAASPDILEPLMELSQKTSVLVSISIETNRDETYGFGEPCCSVRKRLKAILALSKVGIATQASISPIMPCDPLEFARTLKQNGVWRVILDHWEIGDGSKGKRTKRTGVPRQLNNLGYDSKWFCADILDEIEPAFVSQRFPGGVGRKDNFFAFIPRKNIKIK